MSGWDWTDESRSGLGRFLAARDLTGPVVTTRPIGDGHSNLTYLVSDGDRRVVVRRPPPPPTPPGAHDMLREARILAALGPTAVPVADVLATAPAGEVIDVPFYVMGFVDGPVVTTSTPPPLDTPATRRAIGLGLVDTLADLHAVDWQAAGLADVGRPEGFNARHLRRMARLVVDEQGRLPGPFAPVHDWLASRVPAEAGAAVVHNDFRIGNVVLSTSSPGAIAAVLDWELATIGDPLFDLGYFLASLPTREGPLTPTAELGTAVLEAGYPSVGELTTRYAARTGHDLARLDWYVVMAQWKLAVLYEYGRRRADAGVGDSYYTDPALVRSFLVAAHLTADLPPARPDQPSRAR